MPIAVRQKRKFQRAVYRNAAARERFTMCPVALPLQPGQSTVGFWAESVVRIAGRADTLHDNLGSDIARAAFISGRVQCPASRFEIDVVYVDRAADFGTRGPH